MDIPKRVLISQRLRLLLSVSAPERKFKAWTDSEGRLIDCNIYDARYGYPLLSKSEVTCILPDGTFTNKDGVSVFEKEVLRPDHRLAESDNDFKEIFEREFRASEQKDTEGVRKAFTSLLIKTLNDSISMYEESDSVPAFDFSGKAVDPTPLKQELIPLPSHVSGDAELLDTARRFIEYLRDTTLQAEFVIEGTYLSLIYTEYKDLINEGKSIWLKRFDLNSPPIEPMILASKDKKGADRLSIIAILSSIQKYKRDYKSFNFNDFILDRFGIKNFDKAKHDNKDKPEFQAIFNNCKSILKEMTPFDR